MPDGSGRDRHPAGESVESIEAEPLPAAGQTRPVEAGRSRLALEVARKHRRLEEDQIHRGAGRSRLGADQIHLEVHPAADQIRPEARPAADRIRPEARLAADRIRPERAPGAAGRKYRAAGRSLRQVPHPAGRRRRAPPLCRRADSHPATAAVRQTDRAEARSPAAPQEPERVLVPAREPAPGRRNREERLRASFPSAVRGSRLQEREQVPRRAEGRPEAPALARQAEDPRPAGSPLASSP